MKLRSSYLFYKKGVTMEEDNLTVESSKDKSNEDVTSEITDSLLKKRSVIDLVESLSNQLKSLKEVFTNKVDSINFDFSNKLDKKIDELKGELKDHFIDIQKEIKVHIDSRQVEFSKEIREKISELTNDKCNVKGIVSRLDTDGDIHSNHNDRVLFDMETRRSDITDNSIVQTNGTSNSVMSEKVTLSDIVTPIKTFSLPCISETPDFMKPSCSSYSVNTTTGPNPLIVPCTVIPTNILQNIPVLTVAPAHTSLTVCSSIIQSPITRPLKTIKPKLTTEEFIASNFDGNFDDCVRPIHRFKESGDRHLLPGHPRVRTRGGLRRGDHRNSCVISTIKNACTLSPQDRGSNRGGRRGQKPKQYPLIRRQSERLKKLECDSPKKETLRDAIGNIPIEEYIWGTSCNDKDEQVLNSEKSLDIINNSFQSKGSENDDSSVLDSLSQIDTICNSIQNNKDKSDPPIKELDNLKLVENINVSKHCENVKGSAKATFQESSVKDNTKSNDVPKETPRNLRVPSKKGLSLSSPKKASHVRALDFATPIKAMQPRKANTSPKAVSQAKLAQMRSLRRTNLFKTPVKKSKPSWDADLRAFVAPNLSTAAGSVKKNTRSKNPGRPQKLSSPIKKSLLKKANKKPNIKRALKNKKASPANSAENTFETSAEIKSPAETSGSPGKASKSAKLLETQPLKAILKDASASSDTPKALPEASEAISKPSKTCSKFLETPEKACKSLILSPPETPSKTAEELVKQIEKDVLEVISENDHIDSTNNNSTSSCSQNYSLDSSNECKEKQNRTLTLEVQSRQDKKNRAKQSGDNFALPSQLIKKVIHKTPAKTEQAGLPNMMTPVTKILKEQSSLLDNVQFLTPGFLPTPEGQGLDADVRKVGTPSPNPILSKAGEEMTDSDSDQSSEDIRECPVTIEEALAAEEQVVKPLVTKPVKSSVSKSLEKSPQNASKSVEKLSKKKIIPSFLHTGQTFEKKSSKNKSYEDLIIDQCLKNVEKEIYGVEVKKSPKKYKTKDNVKVTVMKKQTTKKKQTCDKKSNKTATMSKNKAVEKSRVDIKLPTFDEMMSRLNKLNSLSSSSSTDSSDSENNLNTEDPCDNVTNQLHTLSPKVVDSKGKTQCQQSSLDKYVKPLERYKQVKKSVSRSVKNANDGLRNVTKVGSTSCLSMEEQIRDLSFEYRNGSSNLKELSYDYFDEAKNGERTVQASPMYQLFQFPFHKKGNISKNVSCDSIVGQTMKSSVSSTNQISKTLEFQNSSKISEDKKSIGSISRSYKHLDESHCRLPKSVRLTSKEPCYSRRASKTFLSSHRSRYSDRGITPMARRRRQSKERYKDSVHSRYKRERTEEFRRRGRNDLDDRRSRSSDSREYCNSFSKVDCKKEKEYTRSSDHNNRKDRRYRSPPGESQKKRCDKFSSDHYRYRDSIYKCSSKRDSADKKGDKTDDRNRNFNCQSLDPRIYLKMRDFSGSKPLAQSTPCDRKKDKFDGSRESSNISLSKSTCYESDARKSLRIDTSATSLEKTLPQNVVEPYFRSSPLKINLTENNMMSELGEIPGDLNPGKLIISNRASELQSSDFELKYVSESPSSPQDLVSHQSPPRDPRKASKSYSYTRVVNSSERQSKSFKRKQEDLEEGEITDDSSNSYQQSKYSSYTKKRKLSNIPEKDD